MNKIFSFCSVAAIAFALISCDSGNSNSSPTDPSQQENDVFSSSSKGNQSAASSATNSDNGFAELNDPEKDVILENESNGLPSMYGECRSPVYWNLADTAAMLDNSTPPGTYCDSLDIRRPETWKYAFKYTTNEGIDTVSGYHNFHVNEECHIIRTRAIFTATPQSHIKKHGTKTLTPSFIAMCKNDECFSTLNILDSFKEVLEACLNITKKEDIQMFQSFDEIAVDTTIYITQAEYDCEYNYLCDEL